jgi:HTH-type transcriptional regulator, sugar sensing transcriptional regulator
MKIYLFVGMVDKKANISYYLTMERTEVLEKLGLTEKEASVYLALLELGTAAVQTLANKAGVKRTTVYSILSDLQKRGLVQEVPQTKKALYTAESPQYLLTNLNKQQELLNRFLPDLLVLHNRQKEKPKVQLFQGEEGVKLVYQKIFEAGGAWFFGTSTEVAKLDAGWANAFFKRMRQNRYPVRDLFSKNPQDMAYAKNHERGPMHEVRWLPPGMSFPSDNAIFGDNVVFFSFRPQIFCVMVTSKEVAQSLKVLFELAWQSVRPFVN